MTWIKLDDQYFLNPKSRAAGKDGRALDLAAICYCSSALTDGFVSTEALPMLLALAEVKRVVVKRLVDAGRWELADGGWLVVNYSERQRSRSDVETQREATRVRVKKHRGNAVTSTKKRVTNSDVTTPEVEVEGERETEPTKTIAPRTGARAPDLLFDAVSHACGIQISSLTGPARGALNRACAELRGAKAAPCDVAVRAANYHATYPQTALTPSALAKHWPALAHPPSNGHGNLSRGGQAVARVRAQMEAERGS